MSKVFQKGDNVVLYIPLPDEATLGTPIASANYSVYDYLNAVVVDNAVLPLDNVDLGTFGSDVILNIPAIDPATMPMVSGSPRAFYRVIVRFVADSGFVHQHFDEFYYEELLVDLEPPINAFTTYGYIMSLAGCRTDLWALLENDQDARISALCQAFDDIKELPLIITRTADTITGSEVAGDYKIIESLQDGSLVLNAAEERNLGLAQTQQANYILGGYAAEDNRKIGITQSVSGASSTLYRTGKVLPIALCNAAVNTLKPYIKYKIKVGRVA